MVINPSSPYAEVRLNLTFLVRKGGGSSLSMGTLGTEGHAAIAAALDKAIEMHLPEGFSLAGSKLEIGDL